MTSLALNQIVRKSVSTYNWVISDDWVWEMAEDDLKSLVDNKSKIKLKKDGKIKKVDIDKISIDIDRDSKRAKILFAECFQKNIEDCCYSDKWDLASVLKRYGLLYHGMNFFMPHYYNYEDDEVWISLTEDQFEDDDLPPRQETNPELIPLVQEYIDNVMVRSYDGYCSFEPTSVDRVDRLDYAYLWAVLKYEDLYEKVQQWIDDWIAGCDEIQNEITTIYYRYDYSLWNKDYHEYYNMIGDKLVFNYEYSSEVL